MKKVDIIEKLSDARAISKKEATEIVDFVFDTMKSGVVDDGEVDIYGFMKLTKVHKDASTAHSPKTGETVNVPEKDVPKAKFSKAFKDMVNA